MQTKTITTATKTDAFTLRDILTEIRLLRNEIKLVLPQEDLRMYAHPQRIKRSYEKALKQYPPA